MPILLFLHRCEPISMLFSSGLSKIPIGERIMLTIKRAEELGRILEKILTEHPEADRDTVFRFLRNLEIPPIERLRRVLHFGPYALSRRLP